MTDIQILIKISVGAEVSSNFEVQDTGKIQLAMSENLITEVINTKMMNTLKGINIEETAKTPHIELNPGTGDFIFSGRSIPENAAKLYEPVLNWMTEYIHVARPVTNVRINLEYFNTSSSLWLAKILKVLVRINEPDYILIIHLYLPLDEYDDMKEFDDIKDVFFPITDIFQFAIPGIGIKLYGTNEESQIVKNKMIFI